MTDKDIKRVIRTCHIRSDYPKGRQSRYLSDVICRDYCLPCMRVIEKGKCPKIKELFKAKERKDKEVQDGNINS